MGQNQQQWWVKGVQHQPRSRRRSKPLPQCRLLASWVGLLGWAIALGGCALVQPASSTTISTRPTPERQPVSTADLQTARVYDPVTRTWVVTSRQANLQLDTLRWVEASTTVAPPFRSTSPTGLGPTTAPSRGPVPGAGAAQAAPGRIPRPGRNPNGYRLVVALPFLANEQIGVEGGAADPVSQWSVHFYSGMKLALLRLEQQGLALTVNVVDTRADTVVWQQLLQTPSLQQADLIIGPYRRDNIRIGANFARQNGKILVSPFSAASNLTRDNPQFLQVNPSLETHCRALTRAALAEFAPDELVMVTRNQPLELTCLGYCQAALRENTPVPGASTGTVYYLPGDSTVYQSINLRPYLVGRRKVAFVVPSWADEKYLRGFLAQLHQLVRSDQTVAVYGMPQWQEFNTLDYEWLERCRVRITSNAYVNAQSPEVLSFRQEFFYRFGILPSTEAFLGYDLTLYLGEQLQKVGLRFFETTAAIASPGLATQFDFQPVVAPSPYGAEFPGLIQRYENQFVHLLEFVNYQFRPLLRP